MRTMFSINLGWMILTFIQLGPPDESQPAKRYAQSHEGDLTEGALPGLKGHGLGLCIPAKAG